MKKIVPLAILLMLVLGGCASTPASSMSSAVSSEAVETPIAAQSIPLPDVVGLSLDVARAKLSQLDLKVSAKSVDGKSILVESNWKVLSQSKASGTKVAPGTIIDLTVGKDSTPTTSSAPPPAPLVQVPPGAAGSTRSSTCSTCTSGTAVRTGSPTGA